MMRFNLTAAQLLKPDRLAGIRRVVLMIAAIAALSGGSLHGQRAAVGGAKAIAPPSPIRSGVVRPIRPRAEITGPADGIHCTAATDNGVGVHNLGFLPAGLSAALTVESFSQDFDPVAAVIVATLGENGGNTIRTTTFYDDNSGGDKDPRIEFVTPVGGTYLLLVNDLRDAVVGCYRYQLSGR
jgi:hypothetical protein